MSRRAMIGRPILGDAMAIRGMKRREFIAGLGGAVVWPVVARAQLPMPVIGYLGSSSPAEKSTLEGFSRGLNETGYAEGRNVAIEYRWAEGHYDRLPALATDLVSRQVAIIFAGGPPAAIAAKKATSTIPIVFIAGPDPVAQGLVASFNRPGDNATGLNFISSALGAKRLDLLHQLVPDLALVAALVNPKFPPSNIEVDDLQKAASAMGLQTLVMNATSEREFDTAFETFAQKRANALVAVGDIYSDRQTRFLVAMAARYGIPTIYSLREFAEAGGLITYGNNISDAFHQMGVYTGRILNGAKAANLPVVQLANFELVINIKTAKTLGLTVSPKLLAIADEVIE
jgi:putative tryptophan/tyrosine transport system substrate-binding protein